MVDTDKNEKFIELRAQGLSFDTIAKKLNISKPTLIKMHKKLELDINRLKLINLESLAEQYKMSKSARLKTLGEMIGKLDLALESADFNKLSIVQLIELRLKLSDRMKAELEFIHFEPSDSSLLINYDSGCNIQVD